MLTDSEREWLEERDNWFSPWCRRCDGRFHCDEHKLYGKCSLTPDTDDAALFEAHVAAKLAGITESMMQTIQEYDDTYPCWACPANENCAGLACREVLLRYARLAVEEETDAD